MVQRHFWGVSWCCGNYCWLAFVLLCGYCSVSFQSFVLRHWCPQHQETTHFWEKVHVLEILSARKVKLGIKWCKVLNIYVLFFMLSTKNIAVFTWFLIKWNQIRNDLRSFECNLCNCVRSLKIIQEFNLFNHDLAIPVRCSNQLSSCFNFQFLIKSKMAAKMATII